MFDLMKMFEKKRVSKDLIAQMLRTNPQMLEEFEAAYAKRSLNVDDDNLFSVNAKMAAKQNETNKAIDSEEDVDLMAVKDMVDTIVDELVAQTKVWKYDGHVHDNSEMLALPAPGAISAAQISQLPVSVQPQLTSDLMKVDISSPSYVALLEDLALMHTARNEKNRKQLYHHFRQGLDILDLDPIVYDMLSANKNSMGYWLPKLVEAIPHQDFFKVPKTTIIKVPMTMLQLTRQDYFSLTRTTLEIVDKFCQRVFELDEQEEYFIKTGTYSSKFDFRNAHVKGAQEVRELGEYLLFIHFQALQMASPLSQPTIYGVSTTNEWVVREFIKDVEKNPCIYNGMPLHTEYRIFVDFDRQRVVGANPYWDPQIMKNRFGHSADSDSPNNVHDYIIYQMHEEKLLDRYKRNVDLVREKIEAMLPDIRLEGQWSIDVMQNGDDFWIIDMALAENSAMVECIPPKLRKPPREEDWLECVSLPE